MTAFPEAAQAVVIGGGILGCSTAYHLVEAGLRDVVLLERKQLTCGTTWHSAAQVRQLRSTRNLTQLIKDSVALYGKLEAETGLSTGWNQTGSFSIACNPDRLIHLRRQAALARLYGIEVEEVDAAAVAQHWPLARTDDVVGAIYSPSDGRVNPSDLCRALVKSARRRGLTVIEEAPVTGFELTNGRVAAVETEQGRIACETAVICAGLWSRSVAALAGAAAPVQACEHFYLLTKPIEGITGHLPTLGDHDGGLYIRDDVGGLLVGCFEPMGKALPLQELPKDFAFDLLPEDWDHFEPMMMNALHRIPALETAEVRMLLNGPESFTPDGSFLLGPAPEVEGLYYGCGMNSVGVATGGGAGKALAAWIAEGAAPMDLDEAHPARFNPLEAQTRALLARAPEALGLHYAIGFPGREYQTARGLKCVSFHDRLVQEGAVFGQRFGWERALYFGAPDPAVPPTFGRPAWFDNVAAEVRAAHESVALFDQSSFGKIRVSGSGAEAFLQRLCANDMSRAPGRAIYTALLNPAGGIESDLTALRLGASDYLLLTGTNRLRRDLAWLRRHRQPGEAVTFEDQTDAYAIIGVMGPQSRALLQALGAVGFDNGAFAYFSHREAELAGTALRATRLSYVGELGWELLVESAKAPAVFDRLLEAGRAWGIRCAGALAQTAMRLEKSFLSIGHDIGPDVTPLDANLGFAVKLKSGLDFIGRPALEAQARAGAAGRLVSLVFESGNACPIGHEPILCKGRHVGQITSAGYGHRIAAPVALAFLEAALLPSAGELPKVVVDIAGERQAARLVRGAVFDPEGLRMRG